MNKRLLSFDICCDMLYFSLENYLKMYRLREDMSHPELLKKFPKLGCRGQSLLPGLRGSPTIGRPQVSPLTLFFFFFTPPAAV
jgi:hypothetical protein